MAGLRYRPNYFNQGNETLMSVDLYIGIVGGLTVLCLRLMPAEWVARPIIAAFRRLFRRDKKVMPRPANVT